MTSSHDKQPEWEQEYPKDNRYKDWPLSEKVTISPELVKSISGEEQPVPAESRIRRYEPSWYQDASGSPCGTLILNSKGKAVLYSDHAAELEKLRQALREINAICESAPELNMSNYDEGQVSELNEAMIQATLKSRAIPRSTREASSER